MDENYWAVIAIWNEKWTNLFKYNHEYKRYKCVLI